MCRHVPAGQQGTVEEQNPLYKSDQLLPLLKIVPTEPRLYCEAVRKSSFLKIKSWVYVHEQTLTLQTFEKYFTQGHFWKLQERSS